MFVLNCPACGKLLRIEDKYRGQIGRCNGCGGAIQVPRMRTVDKFAAIIVGVFIVLIVISNMMSGPPPDPPQTAEQQPAIDAQKPVLTQEQTSVTAEAPIAPEPATAPPPVSELQFETIRNAMLNTTSIQADRYRKSVEGKRVVWSGWVEESREKLFGGYEVWIDMDPPSEVVSVQDVSFDVTESEAIALSKNQHVQFEGTINSVVNVLGSCQVNLKDASVR